MLECGLVFLFFGLFFYFSKLLSPLLFRYTAEEIEEKVNSFRMMLQEKEEPVVNTNERPT